MSLVQGRQTLEYGSVELEELVLAGDDTAWAVEDWAWDGKSFTATPISSTRGGKRHCYGLHSDYAEHSLQEAVDCPAPCCRASFPQRDNSEASGILAGQLKENYDTAHETVEGLKQAGHLLCQVEGCNREVSGLSTYYQRCRICEIHIKEPQFMRQGKLQRFCQQCGRCHELSAFQGTKRSCKDQLAKHNARRRRRTEKKAPPSDAGQQLAELMRGAPCQARLEDAFALLGATPSTSSPSISQPLEGPPLSFPLPAITNSACPNLDEGLRVQAAEAASLSLGPNDSPPCLLSCPQQPLMEAPASSGPACAVGIPVPNDEHCGSASQRPGGSSFEAARALLGQQMPARQPYRSENLVVRLSIKLFNCTPAELPEDLKQQLTGWLKSSPAGAEGYLRPGCVHLIMQAHLLAESAQTSKTHLQPLLSHLLTQRHSAWREKALLIDLNGQLALLKAGQVLAAWNVNQQQLSGNPAAQPDVQAKGLEEGSRERGRGQQICSFPTLVRIEPSVIFQEDSRATKVELVGEGISSMECKVLCRAKGSYHEVAYHVNGDAGHTCCQPVESRPPQDHQSIAVTLPETLQPGLAWLEVTKGCMLSSPLPLLVCPEKALAEELREWALQNTACNELLTDVGLLMSEISNPAEAEQLLPTAHRLAKYGAEADLPELLKFLISRFPVAMLSAPEEELSLLHLCVQNASHRALEALLKLGKSQVTHAGPQGITPLHLAAFLGDKTACKLLASCSLTGWKRCLAADGLSPSDFAAQAGFLDLDHEMSEACTPSSAAQIARLLEMMPPNTAALSGQDQASCGPQNSPNACALNAGDVFLTIEGEEGGGSGATEESAALLGIQAERNLDICMSWPGPLATVAPRGPLGKWSNVALLSVVACLCICVALLRSAAF